MIRILSAAVILSFTVACTNSSGKSMATPADSTLHTSNSQKVLIELFTSQGCSSCPSADKLMGNLMTADTNVIALSFHVDYWDRLGWKDVFSNHDYTLRQQQYVKALKAESLYTPQAVVQGQYEMVGSNRTQVLDAVNKARSGDSAAQTLTANTLVKGSAITLNYDLSAPQSSQQIVVALVQNQASTSVAKGENGGKQLGDYNVVRNLFIQPAHESGNIEISLPDDLKKENATVVLFTQDEQTKQIGIVKQLYL